MIMNAKLARGLVSAVAIGALSFGAVACGGGDQEEKQSPTRTEKRTSTPTQTVTERETVTEMMTMRMK